MLASKEKVSTRQATILFLMAVYSPGIRLFPTITAKIGERAGWLAPILSVLPFICLVYIMQALFKCQKNANLSDLIIEIFGNILGRVVILLYFIWFMVLLGLYVRYFAERFLTSLIPNTPMEFFTLTILAVSFYAVRGGLVSLIRATEFNFMSFTVIFVILFLLSLTNVEIINLLPVTHYDILPVAKSTYSILGIWAYYTFIFFFADKINDKEHIRRFGLQGAVFLVIMGVMLLIQTIGVYGYTIIQRISLSYFAVIKSISIFDTIERIESVTLAFWVIVDFVIIAFFMYIIMCIVKSFFRLSGTKSMASPIAVFAFIFSAYIAQNRFELENFSNHIGIELNIFFGFGIPLILLVVGKLRKKI